MHLYFSIEKEGNDAKQWRILRQKYIYVEKRDVNEFSYMTGAAIFFPSPAVAWQDATT